MLLTALLIVVLTAAADGFGPAVAGALSALPALASVLAVFTHRRDGTGALLILLRGTTEGMVSFAAFCAVAARCSPGPASPRPSCPRSRPPCSCRPRSSARGAGAAVTQD